MGQDKPTVKKRPGADGAEALFVEQLRRGDPDAVRRFFHEQYAGIYRYLLWLAERPELAEDLAQETFLRAWRALNRFDARLPLRPWLHRIAHREFLRALRSRRVALPLDEAAEATSPEGADWADAVALREAIRKLPREEREIVVLHDLQGYSSAEVAQIVDAPAGTVRYRLSVARERLRRELGEGDLTYLNQEPEAVLRRWAWLPLEALTALEVRLACGNEGWLEGAQGMSERSRAGMSRRELLEAAGTAAAAAAIASVAPPTEAASPREAEVIDERLGRKVTLGVKAMALVDLCELLRRETRVELRAGPSVADEKVTLFCERMPLRDVMRQLSRPFGYAWLRSGTADPSPSPSPGGRGELHGRETGGGTKSRPLPRAEPSAREAGGGERGYRYELVQDLRSQLLEEELRHRDRNAALLAVDREMQRYRPFLELSTEEAEARARTAAPGEKELLEHLARYGWGPIQMYFRLSGSDLADLRAGATLVFSAMPRPGERPLPADVSRGVLQGLRDWRVAREGEALFLFPFGKVAPELGEGLPPASVAEVRVRVDLSIPQSELGRLAFSGGPGLFTTANFPLRREAPRGFDYSGPNGPWAVGVSASVLQLDNSKVNARWAHDPALRARVSVRPEPSCRLEAYPGPLGDPRGGPRATEEAGDRVTSADVLEALHRATGMPIVSDYYTRLYKPDAATVKDQILFEALNRLSDAMHLRWDRDEEGGWLRFRSTSFYDDRLKEVPNRLLSRWSAARRQNGHLQLDELVEIASLSDAQLDADSMAEGARACFGLAEWELARHPVLRPYLRDLAQFTPAQRAEAMSPAGLRFTRMSLAQQQLFLARALDPKDPPLQSLDELAGAALWIDYTQPGWFEWVPGYPGPWQTWLMPVGADQRAPRPRVRERTREAALEGLRRVDPKLRAAIWESRRRDDPGYGPPPDLAGEIYPTRLDLVIITIPGASHQRPIRIVSAGLVSCQWTE